MGKKKKEQEKHQKLFYLFKEKEYLEQQLKQLGVKVVTDIVTDNQQVNANLDQMALQSVRRRKSSYSSMANNGYNNRIDSSSTSTRIDDIANSIYDGVEDLLEYVYEQDELIEEQNRQIAQLEKQILNHR